MPIKLWIVKSKVHLQLLYNWVFCSNIRWKAGLNIAIRYLTKTPDELRCRCTVHISLPLCFCHLAPGYKYVMMFNAEVKKRFVWVCITASSAFCCVEGKTFKNISASLQQQKEPKSLKLKCFNSCLFFNSPKSSTQKSHVHIILFVLCQFHLENVPGVTFLALAAERWSFLENFKQNSFFLNLDMKPNPPPAS